MKNTIKLMCAATVALMVASCTDLDVPVESQYTQYPSNEIAQEAKLAGVYFHLRGTWGRRYMEAMTLSSDEYVGYSFGSDSYWDDGTYQHATLHNYNQDDASIGWYEDVTAGITKTNSLISELGANSKGGVNARALRAFYHWILVDCYGDTPLLNRNLNEGESIERSSRATVTRWIESELKDVIYQNGDSTKQVLTTDVTSNTYGKPTRYMAEALLAKLYINWPVYTATSVDKYEASTYENIAATPSEMKEKLEAVVTLCDDIINSGKFSLTEGAANHKCGNTYRAKFLPDNGSQIKDFIYAMPYSGPDKDGMQYGRPRTWKKGNTWSYYGAALSKSVGGNFAMTPEASDRFSLPGDLRNEMIVGAAPIYEFSPSTYAKTDKVYLYKGDTVSLTKTINIVEPEYLAVSNDMTGYAQGYRSVKWFIIDDDFKYDRNQSNDVPIFRLADIILLKAEALMRLNAGTNNAAATALLNQIRAYNNAPAFTGTLTLSDILEERGRELFDENWRRNDMIRFGTFESVYGVHTHTMKYANFEKSHRIFPIPTEVLNKHTNWHQNDGY